MKRFILTLCLLLSAVPAIATQVIVEDSTTTPIRFKVVDTDNAGVTGLTISSVWAVVEDGTPFQLTSFSGDEVANMAGVYEFLANSGMAVPSGKVEANVVFNIVMSDSSEAAVQAIIKAPQATLSELAAEVWDYLLNTLGPINVKFTPEGGSEQAPGTIEFEEVP